MGRGKGMKRGGGKRRKRKTKKNLSKKNFFRVVVKKVRECECKDGREGGEKTVRNKLKRIDKGTVKGTNEIT